MLVEEYAFTEYYHKYVTIEADELTEELNDVIKINEQDCYTLCSSYCNEEGLLCFNVLSVGKDWEHCTRGLRYKKMLGTFTIDQVQDKEMRIVEPDYSMIHKNQKFLEEMDEGLDEDFLKTRLDQRLDNIRDLYYPDAIWVGVIVGNSLYEYTMKITGIEGPFLVGEMFEEPVQTIDLHVGEKLYALPYLTNEGVRMFALFGGDHMDPESKKAMDQILKETSDFGIDFNGISLKS